MGDNAKGDGVTESGSAQDQFGDQDGRKLSPAVQDQLGKKLRQTYSNLIAEPLPDKFRQLLDQLGGSSKSSEEEDKSS